MWELTPREGDARVGEVPGEYCPGEHSVNAEGRMMTPRCSVARGGRFCDQRNFNMPFLHEFKLAGNYTLPLGVGALLGNLIAPRGSKTLGTIIGGAGGAAIGYAIERGELRCE